jgi:hypothetical protein
MLWVGPELSVVLSSSYGTGEASIKIIARGGHVRSVTDITDQVIDPVQQHLDIGYDIRHFDKYSGIFL